MNRPLCGLGPAPLSQQRTGIGTKFHQSRTGRCQVGTTYISSLSVCRRAAQFLGIGAPISWTGALPLFPPLFLDAKWKIALRYSGNGSVISTTNPFADLSKPFGCYYETRSKNVRWNWLGSTQATGSETWRSICALGNKAPILVFRQRAAAVPLALAVRACARMWSEMTGQRVS